MDGYERIQRIVEESNIWDLINQLIPAFLFEAIRALPLDLLAGRYGVVLLTPHVHTTHTTPWEPGFQRGRFGTISQMASDPGMYGYDWVCMWINAPIGSAMIVNPDQKVLV